jgi:hypothetical protein
MADLEVGDNVLEDELDLAEELAELHDDEEFLEHCAECDECAADLDEQVDEVAGAHAAGEVE